MDGIQGMSGLSDHVMSYIDRQNEANRIIEERLTLLECAVFQQTWRERERERRELRDERFKAMSDNVTD